MTHLINIADLVDQTDPQKRTFRQINAEQTHGIHVGALVEIKDTGVRMFVVHQGRDCDQTPLYWLSPDKDDVTQRTHGFYNYGWHGGYSEGSLLVVNSSNVGKLACTNPDSRVTTSAA